jgi:type VI secretion system protein ImpF
MKQTPQTLQGSILDRLIDHEPGLSKEPVQSRYSSVSQIRASVIRDLENLFNTKRQITPVPSVFKEVNRSLFVYGLNDFTSQNPKSPSVRQQLRQDIEKTVNCFEPRLKNVTVHLEKPTQNERSLKFRITALLVIDPISEPITFDTYFDANRSQFTISK